MLYKAVSTYNLIRFVANKFLSLSEILIENENIVATFRKYLNRIDFLAF